MNPLHDFKYILSLAYKSGYKWHISTLPFKYSAFSPKYTNFASTDLRTNKSKDIFDNNIPFTSLNCTISHPASIIFWKCLRFSPSLESIDAYFSIYAYNEIIHATNLNKSYFFWIYTSDRKSFPNLIHCLEAIKSDQYFWKSNMFDCIDGACAACIHISNIWIVYHFLMVHG